MNALAAILEQLSADQRDSMFAACKEHSVDPDKAEVLYKGAQTDPAKMKLNEGERSVRQWMTTRHLDRDGEIVVPGGLILGPYKKNPVKLWQHRRDLPAIGSNPVLDPGVMGIQAKTVYDENPDNKLASIAWGLRSKGHLRTSSIGFIRLQSVFKGDGKFLATLKKLQGMYRELTDKVAENVQIITLKGLLIEDSDVNVPANANALTLEVAKGLGDMDPETLNLLGFGDLYDQLQDVYKDFEPGADLGGDSEPEQTVKVVSTPFAKVVEPASVKVIQPTTEQVVEKIIDREKWKV